MDMMGFHENNGIEEGGSCEKIDWMLVHIALWSEYLNSRKSHLPTTLLAISLEIASAYTAKVIRIPANFCREARSFWVNDNYGGRKR